MKFGVREVMVIAALAFGVVAAGCSTSFKTNLAMDPHLRAMNAGGWDHRICFSKYEFEFYNMDIEPTLREPVFCKTAVKLGLLDDFEFDASSKLIVSGGPGAAGPESPAAGGSWSPSLPAFFK